MPEFSFARPRWRPTSLAAFAVLVPMADVTSAGRHGIDHWAEFPLLTEFSLIVIILAITFGTVAGDAGMSAGSTCANWPSSCANTVTWPCLVVPWPRRRPRLTSDPVSTDPGLTACFATSRATSAW